MSRYRGLREFRNPWANSNFLIPNVVRFRNSLGPRYRQSSEPRSHDTRHGSCLNAIWSGCPRRIRREGARFRTLVVIQQPQEAANVTSIAQMARHRLQRLANGGRNLCRTAKRARADDPLW